MEVIDKVVLITGAANGLGLSMAEHFIENGAKLTIIVDLNESQGKEAEQKLKATYGADKVVFLKGDVTTDLDRIFKEVTKVNKTIDLIVNNAGVTSENNIKRIIDVNTTAVMEWTMKFYDYMRKDRGGQGGTIINVSSIFGYRIVPFIPYYHASKFAVLGFSKSLGHDYNYKKTGVRVVTLCPGLTKTALAVNFKTRDEKDMDMMAKVSSEFEWQEVEYIGRGTVEIYKNAKSGTAWVVEGERPPEEVIT